MSPSPATFLAPMQDLAQRNTGMVMRFWTSPDVVNQMRSVGESMVREAQASTMKLFQSAAFTALSRELFGSYTQFWNEAMQAQVENAAEVQQRTVEQVTKAGSAAQRRAA